MTVQTALRVDKLTLKNFRCFADCTLALHPELTVLVADNGSGKSALLDALAVAIGPFVDAVADTTQSRGLVPSDVRLTRDSNGGMKPQLPAEFAALGFAQDKEIEWARSLTSFLRGAKNTTKDARKLRGAGLAIRRRLEPGALDKTAMEHRHSRRNEWIKQHRHREIEGLDTPDTSLPVLPVIAFYGTGRLWSEHRLTNSKRFREVGRTTGYTDCLTPSSSFKTFTSWYRAKVEEMKLPGTGPRADRPEFLVAAVIAATKAILAPSGWTNLGWDIEHDRLFVEHPEHGMLPLSYVSDGVQNIVSLVADLAHRCARLNPHLGLDSARQTPGVVLIDEVDMHLHPRWQQQIVGLLREAFPLVQFVLSTHSPQVLSTVDVECIRVIRHTRGVGMIDTPSQQTRGAESAGVMASVMNVDPKPPVSESDDLSRYKALVQTGNDHTDEAQTLWQGLVEHFGEDHPSMREAAVLKQLQDFRRGRVQESGEDS